MHNGQDFVQILYFAGEVCIIDENNVFTLFFKPGNHMSAIFDVYYCQICLYFFTCLDTIPQDH